MLFRKEKMNYLCISISKILWIGVSRIGKKARTRFWLFTFREKFSIRTSSRSSCKILVQKLQKQDWRAPDPSQILQ